MALVCTAKAMCTPLPALAALPFTGAAMSRTLARLEQPETDDRHHRVVKLARAGEIVAADRDVMDHAASSGQPLNFAANASLRRTFLRMQRRRHGKGWRRPTTDTS